MKKVTTVLLGMLLPAAVPLALASSSSKDIGGLIKNQPGAVRILAGKEMKVFARGDDNAMWVNTWLAYKSAWTGWSKVGGTIISAPSCTHRKGIVDCFVRNTASGISHNALVNGKWQGWDDLGGKSLGAPDAVSDGQGRIFIAIRGNDDAMWTRFFDEDHGGWQEWRSEGGKITTDPACALSLDQSRTRCLAAGTDGLLWAWTMGESNPWSKLGAPAKSKVSPILTSDNTILVFRENENGTLSKALWQKLAAGFGQWTAVGGQATGGPACISMSAAGALKPDVHCFSRSATGSVRWDSFSGLE